MPGIQHEYLIERAKAAGWLTSKPWSEAFLKLAEAHEREQRAACPEIRDIMREFRLIPDAWRVVSKQDAGCDKLLVLELLEVDVGGPVSEAKLALYDQMWWYFDGSAFFELRVYRMDRAGTVSVLVDADSAMARDRLRWKRSA
jgi:hypothetical protein